MVLSDEDRVLLYCARTKMNEELKEKTLEILSRSLDWSYIVKNASQHGISPLLYYNLNKISTDNLVPEKESVYLKKEYYRNLSRIILIYDELEKILTSFNDAGIDVLVLKGAALATTLYPDIGLRPMSDIDILCHENDLSKAKQKLFELGFAIAPDLKELYEKGLPVENYYLKHHPHLPQFYKKGRGIFLELHWALTSETLPFHINIEEIWSRAVKAKIAGNDVLVMSDEDSLIYHCTHIARHRFSAKLREYCDVSEIASLPIDWDDITNVAKKNKLKSPVYYALYFTNILLRTPVSEKFLYQLKPGYLTSRIFESLISFEDVLRQKNSKRDAAGLIIEFLLIDKNSVKIRFLISKIFPPIEWLSVNYRVPITKKLYLYYLVRLSDLTIQALRFQITYLKRKSFR